MNGAIASSDDAKDLDGFVHILRGALGDDLEKMAFAVHNFLADELGEDLAEHILHARLDDGSLFRKQRRGVSLLSGLGWLRASLEQMAERG